MINLQSFTLFSHILVVELGSILGDQYLKYPKSTNYVLPEERDHFVGCYIC
jgi:hypothetical protein